MLGLHQVMMEDFEEIKRLPEFMNLDFPQT
jgi:hypothetical protein